MHLTEKVNQIPACYSSAERIPTQIDNNARAGKDHPNYTSFRFAMELLWLPLR